MIEHVKRVIDDRDDLYSSIYDVYAVDNKDEENQLYRNHELMYGLDAELEIDDEIIEKLKSGKTILFTGGEYYSRITYKPQKRPTIYENNNRG